MRRIYLLLFSVVYLTPLWSEESVQIAADTETSIDTTLIIESDTADLTSVDTAFTETSIDTTSIDTTVVDTNAVDSLNVDSLNIDSTNIDNEVGESDTTEIDSALILEQQRSFIALLKEQSHYLYTHPTTADTLFNPYEINRIKYSRDDYFTWNEVLRSHGEFISNYYSPRHYNNVNLWRGYTVPLHSHRSGIVSGPATAELIFPNYEPLQIEHLTLDANGELTAELFPRSMVSTQVYLLMENGLFDGNSLELRMMRNLTRHLALGLFSSFRNLEKKDYTHSPGGISSFYGGIYRDSTNLSIKGRNPYSANHTTVIQLQWQKRSKIDLVYRYQGLSNDLLYPYDSLPDTTSDYDSVWFNRDGFNSDFRMLGEIPLGEKFCIDLEGNIHGSVHRETPVSTTVLSRSESQGAEQEYQGAGGELHFTPSENDTISLVSSVNRSETFHTNDSRTILYKTDVGLETVFNGDSAPFQMKASAGATSLYYFRSGNVYPNVGLSAHWKPNRFMFEGWTKIDIVPVVVEYDADRIPNSGELGDSYLGSGIRATVMGDKLALTTGYSYVYGVSEHSINKFWQNQVAPYSNPGNVVTVTPSFGEWHGLSVSSSWHFADTKPYVKSFSELNMRLNKPGETRHFYTSVYLNYWSGRDDLTYVGRTDWNNPIFDLGTKLTAEIKSFRLFVKIDNLLNRNNSYIPGYYMPGLIFRWGFAWTITG